MASDSLITLRVDGQLYSIDMEDITWGELKSLETHTGKSLGSAELESAHGLVAIAYLAVKRKNPMITIEEIEALPKSGIEGVDDDNKPLPTHADVEEASGTPTSDDVSE